MTVPAGMTSECAPVKGKLWTPVTAVLAALVMIMVGVLAVRFVRGIGAVTNLNDGYPWGLWIVWDVLIGSALGASGFTIAFAMYILNRGEYHPMVRPALLTALLGYSMAGLSVVVDIGRYWNAWHIVWPRYMQPSSVLFEVALCIMAYTGVIAIELSPVVLEKFGMKRTRKAMGRFLFFFVALGVVLPTMHQSSLGSMLLVYGRQIDPLYQTRALPILFLTSTVGMGLAAVTLEGTISSLGLGRPIESDMLAKLMKVCRAVIGAFLVIRFADLAIRGVLPQLFAPTTVALMFWIETLLFVFSISLLGDAPSTRRVVASAMAMALAGILYRIDAYLVAYHTGPGWHYFPSMGEIAVTVGLIAFEILAFIFAIRIFPVMQTKH
ncbi:MAG TPA: Ni/Fe-hydrogenase cytochrome b subunit [Kofleriaceae bacterium]